MKNELVETNIRNMIYEVRGKQVLLDREISATKMTRQRIIDLISFESVNKTNIKLSILN